MSISVLLEALRAVGADASSSASALAAASPDVAAQTAAALAALRLSPPDASALPVRGRPSLTRHRSDLPRTISSAMFGSYIKFVNRTAQCNDLRDELHQTYLKYTYQKREQAPEYIRSINVVFSAGAPGIGQDAALRCAAS